MNPVVFVERDGVILKRCLPAVRRPADVVFRKGALAGLARLDAAGFVLVVTTNQAHALRAGMTQDEVIELHRNEVKAWLAACGIRIALHKIWFDIKPPVWPKPNLVPLAEKELGPIDLGRIWVIEPWPRQAFAAELLGMPVSRALGIKPWPVAQDGRFPTLWEAAEHLVAVDKVPEQNPYWDALGPHPPRLKQFLPPIAIQQGPTPPASQ